MRAIDRRSIQACHTFRTAAERRAVEARRRRLAELQRDVTTARLAARLKREAAALDEAAGREAPRD